MLGVDRHGQLSSRAVKLEECPNDHLPIALGTDTSFGLFHPESYILLADGNRAQLGALFSIGGTIANARFEMIPIDDVQDVEGGAPDFRGLWDSLCRRCFCKSSDVLLVSELKLSSATFSGLPILTKESQGWWSVTRSTLEAAFNSLGPPQRRQLICSLFSSMEGESASFTFFPNEPHHALNVRRWTDRSCFSFESLQYSYRISIASGQSPSGPIQTGKTFFVWPNPAGTYQLSWEDRSWNPILNGFILVGD